MSSSTTHTTKFDKILEDSTLDFNDSINRPAYYKAAIQESNGTRGYLQDRTLTMLTFNHLYDSHPDICAYVAHLYESGYKVFSSTYPFSSKHYMDMVARLEQLGFIRTNGKLHFEHLKVFKLENKCCVLIDGSEIIIAAETEDLLNWAIEGLEYLFLGGDYYETDKRISFDLYFPSPTGVQTTTKRVKLSSFEKIYTELYPQYDIDELLEQFHKSPENILLLYGEPGTGKTSLIKYAFNTAKYVAYTKDSEVITESAFWVALDQNEYDLVILDDLDSELSPRKANKNNSFLSQLLSYTDGTFRNKTKFIITTNMKMDSIDSALVRPGRLFDFLHLETMERDYAENLWIETLKLPREDFLASFSKKHTKISQAELMSEAKRIQIGIKIRSYNKFGDTRYTISDKLSNLGVQIGKNDKKVGF